MSGADVIADALMEAGATPKRAALLARLTTATELWLLVCNYVAIDMDDPQGIYAIEGVYATLDDAEKAAAALNDELAVRGKKYGYAHAGFTRRKKFDQGAYLALRKKHSFTTPGGIVIQPDNLDMLRFDTESVRL